MKSKKTDYITLSYPKFVFAIICITLFFIIVGTLIINDLKYHSSLQKQKYIAQQIPTTTPTETPKPTHPPVSDILQSTTDTSKWETYITPNFSFKYPNVEGWQISQSYSPAGIIVGYNCKGEAVCNKSNLRAIIISRLISISIEEYKKGFGKYLTDIHEITIDGEPSIQGIFPGGTGVPADIRYFVVHKGKSYEITYTFSFRGARKLSDFPDSIPDIVSTFKFTD